MAIKKQLFGKAFDKDVYLFTLDNGKDLTAEIINYGGIIKSLIYKGVDVVLGRDTMEEYLSNSGYLGALVGRNSNRIANSEFVLNGKKYKLCSNNGKCNLHGGKQGFSNRVWDFECKDEIEPELILTLNSPDGDEGFPGNAEIKVTYKLTKRNSIEVHYEGVCDSDTVINMTNHSYFNLNGHGSGTVDKHIMKLESEYFTPNNEECYPTGEVKKVEGTAFDFATPKKLEDGFNADCQQIKMFGGYDHNFAISGNGFRKFCELKGDLTGIIMESYTDCVGVQVYTSNSLDEPNPCKDGAVYGLHQGICLETQAFPNAVNYSHFPSCVLKKGTKYDTKTEYLFK
ncbi:MAG: galactose mutarotase [Clostridia bacterium]|nr:galactose mutarotase [Clostridia bacterium]